MKLTKQQEALWAQYAPTKEEVAQAQERKKKQRNARTLRRAKTREYTRESSPAAASPRIAPTKRLQTPLGRAGLREASSAAAKERKRVAKERDVFRPVRELLRTGKAPALPERKGPKRRGRARVLAAQQRNAGEAPGEKPKMGKFVAGTVLKGANDIAKMGSSFAAWAERQTAGRLLGQSAIEDSPIQRLNRGVDRDREKLDRWTAENTKKGGKALAIQEKLGEMVVATAPQMGVSAATAAKQGIQALSAAPAASKTLKNALKGLEHHPGKAAGVVLKSAPGAAKTVSNAVRGLGKDPNYWVAFLSTVGQDYEQAKADGASENRASLYAITNGLLSAGVEVGGGIQTLPGKLHGNPAAVRTWVDSMLDEGKEEVVQGILGRGLENLVYQKENSLASLRDKGAIFSASAAAEEFAAGAAVGGILSGGYLLGRPGHGEVGAKARSKEEMEVRPEEANELHHSATAVLHPPALERLEALPAQETLRDPSSQTISPRQVSAAEFAAQKISQGKVPTANEIKALDLQDQGTITALSAVGVEIPPAASLGTVKAVIRTAAAQNAAAIRNQAALRAPVLSRARVDKETGAQYHRTIPPVGLDPTEKGTIDRGRNETKDLGGLLGQPIRLEEGRMLSQMRPDGTGGPYDRAIEENRGRAEESRSTIERVSGESAQLQPRGARGDGSAVPGDGGEWSVRPDAPRSRGLNVTRSLTAAGALQSQGPDHSLGEQPVDVRSRGHLMEAPQGSRAALEQEHIASYGVPSFVIADQAWTRRDPAYSMGGQIYLKETLPKREAGKYAYHELTHVMRQVSYSPYLDFLGRIPEMVDYASRAGRTLLKGAAEHRGIDPFTMSLEEADRVYDEINAMVFAALSTGNAQEIAYVRPAFLDFDAYAAELTVIHQQFQKEQIVSAAMRPEMQTEPMEPRAESLEGTAKTAVLHPSVLSQEEETTLAVEKQGEDAKTAKKKPPDQRQPVLLKREDLNKAQETLSKALEAEKKLREIQFPGEISGDQMLKTSAQKILKGLYRASGKPWTMVTVKGPKGPMQVEVGTAVQNELLSRRNLQGEDLALLPILPDLAAQGRYLGPSEHGEQFETTLLLDGTERAVRFEVETLPQADGHLRRRLCRVWLERPDLKPPQLSRTEKPKAADPHQLQEAPVDGEKKPAPPAKGQKSQTEQKVKKARKPVAKSRPILAKKELKASMMELFSIPDGRRSELGEAVDRFADTLLLKGRLVESDRQALFRQMYDAGVLTIPAEEALGAVRAAMMERRIYVSDSVKQEFGEDYQAFRSRAFRNHIYLVNDPKVPGVDVWQKELSWEFPGMFQEEKTDLRAVLERIVETAEAGKDTETPLAEHTREMARQGVVDEEEFLDQMQQRCDALLETFAEKANLEIRLRERTGVKIAQERDKQREQLARQRENRYLREMQQKTLKNLQWLSKNRQKAPEDLKAAFDAVLGDLDLFAVNAANELHWDKKRDASWKDLADLYRAWTQDENFIRDPYLEKIVARLDNDKIGELDIGALQDLYRAAVALRTEFYNRRNVIADEEGRIMAEIYAESVSEIQRAPNRVKEKQQKKGKASPSMAADLFLNQEQLTPMNMIQRMGGWDPDGTFYSMGKMLEEGEKNMRAYTVKANQYLEPFLQKYGDWVKRADGQGADGIWYEIEVPRLLELRMGDKPIFGETVTVFMTPAQKVHMYLESKYQDNLRHMAGGRTFPDRALYSEGERKEAFAQGTTIRLAPETVKHLVQDLTEEEKALAAVLEPYYNQFAKKEINRVSNLLYGCDRAMGGYAPIYTNENYVKQEIGLSDVTPEGVGNLKSRQVAQNPSYQISAFDAFERNVSQTARFVGMAIPKKNWERLLNWREGDQSFRDIISHKWGDRGVKYLENVVERLGSNAIMERDSISSLADKLQSRYISSVFGFNPSIVLKQLGSIPLAGAYLGGKNAPTPAQVRAIDRKLISAYTKELDWRLLGYATPETKFLKENPSWTETNQLTKNLFGGGAITWMDGAAASTLWPWAENKVRRERPDLPVGTPEEIRSGESLFFKQVAKEFDTALSRSQSVSDEMHQGSLRKSKNPIARAFTLFKSDSAQAYNAMRQKIGETKFYERSGETEKAKAAKQSVGITFLLISGGYAWAQMVDFLRALLLKRDDRYRDKDGEITAESISKEFFFGCFQDLAGMMISGAETMELLGSVFTDDPWWGIDTPGLEQITALMDLGRTQAKKTVKSISEMADIFLHGDGLPGVGRYLKEHRRDLFGGVHEITQMILTYRAGFPVQNVEKYMLAPINWLSPQMGTAYEDLLKTPTQGDLDGLSGKALQSRIGTILSQWMDSDTAQSAAEELAALYTAGFPEAIPPETPNQIAVDGEEQILSAHQKQLYDTVWRDQVTGTLSSLLSKEWYQALDQKERAACLAKLYDYGKQKAKTKLFPAAESSSYVWDVSKFTSYGLGMADYLEARWKKKETQDKFQEPAERAIHFSSWADTRYHSPVQAEMVKETFQSMGRSKRYHVLTAGGLKPDRAAEIALRLETFREKGENLTELQIGQAVFSEARTAAEEELALKALLKEETFEKVQMAAGAGISAKTYLTFAEECSHIESDRYANGKVIANSKKRKVMDLIHSMDLTTTQKDTLYDAAGYKRSTLHKDAPWYHIGPKLTRASSGRGKRQGGRRRSTTRDIGPKLIGGTTLNRYGLK